MPSNLLLCPLPFELKILKSHFEAVDFKFRIIQSNPIVIYQTDLFYLALSGLGKTQTAVQAQFVVNRLKPKNLILIGSAAGVAPFAEPGQIVCSTRTIEWGFYPFLDLKRVTEMQTFESSPCLVHAIKGIQRNPTIWNFGPVVCAEENLTSAQRAEDIYRQTGGLALAWEGAGLARVAHFNQLNYVEVRVISDRPEGTQILGPQSLKMRNQDPEVEQKPNLAQVKKVADTGLKEVAKTLGSILN